MSQLHQKALEKQYVPEFEKELYGCGLFDWASGVYRYTHLRDLQEKDPRTSPDYDDLFCIGKYGKITLRVLPFATVFEGQEIPFGREEDFPNKYLIAAVLMDPCELGPRRFFSLRKDQQDNSHRSELRKNLIDDPHHDIVEIERHTYVCFITRLIRDKQDLSGWLDLKAEDLKGPVSDALYHVNMRRLQEFAQKAAVYKTLVQMPEFKELESICCDWRVADILKKHLDLKTLPDLVKHLLRGYRI